MTTAAGVSGLVRYGDNSGTRGAPEKSGQEWIWTPSPSTTLRLAPPTSIPIMRH